MMKVLYLRSNYIDRDSRFKKEVKSLDSFGINVTAFCWNRDENAKDEEEKIFSNSNIYKVNIKSSFGAGIHGIKPFLLFQIKIISYILKNHKKFDFIHCCDFDTGFMTFLVTRLTKTRYVYDIYDYYADSHTFSNFFRKIIVFLENRVINNSYTTIICTEKRKEQISSAHPKKLVVIHNSPHKLKQQVTAKSVQLFNEGTAKRIAYFGIFGNGRMITELMKIVSKNKGTELHIGGYGLLENSIKNYVTNSSNIFFYGKLDYDDVLKKESMCDIITALYDPSDRNHYYAAPNKFYEGAMLGLPLIMAKNTGMSELVDKYHNGVVLEEFTQKCLDKALELIIANYDFYYNNARKFKKIFDDNYSWDIMEKKLSDIYFPVNG